MLVFNQSLGRSGISDLRGYKNMEVINQTEVGKVGPLSHRLWNVHPAADVTW
jgi:hypothetical protein